MMFVEVSWDLPLVPDFQRPDESCDPANNRPAQRYVEHQYEWLLRMLVPLSNDAGSKIYKNCSKLNREAPRQCNRAPMGIIHHR